MALATSGSAERVLGARAGNPSPRTFVRGASPGASRFHSRSALENARTRRRPWTLPSARCARGLGPACGAVLGLDQPVPEREADQLRGLAGSALAHEAWGERRRGA